MPKNAKPDTLVKRWMNKFALKLSRVWWVYFMVSSPVDELYLSREYHIYFLPPPSFFIFESCFHNSMATTSADAQLCFSVVRLYFHSCCFLKFWWILLHVFSWPLFFLYFIYFYFCSPTANISMTCAAPWAALHKLNCGSGNRCATLRSGRHQLQRIPKRPSEMLKVPLSLFQKIHTSSELWLGSNYLSVLAFQYFILAG